jgi:uncharacterized metal-binding protein YceD (DUF177 family)
MTGPEFSRPEFSRIVKLNTLGSAKQTADYAATQEECAGLAARFGLIEIASLSAKVRASRLGSVVSVVGEFQTQVTQACVATGAPVPFKTTEKLAIKFVPEAKYDPDAEIELDADDCDTFEHDGLSIDIGEAIAQSLSLALDPFPRVSDAEKLLKAAGVRAEGEISNTAFAGLSALRDKLAR